MMANTSYRGFTLFEWLITAALVAVMLAISTPAMIQFAARNRMAGAAEALANNLKLARSESIRRGAPIYVRFQPGADWCSGLHESPRCDCAVTDSSAGNACTLAVADAPELRITTSSDFPGVVLSASSFFQDVTLFDPVRGTARPGTLRLSGYQDAELRVILSMLGRVRICTVQGSHSSGWYPPC